MAIGTVIMLCLLSGAVGIGIGVYMIMRADRTSGPWF